jgi:aspergillopepsin I
MLAIAGGSVFLAPVTVGGQQFRVVIDTGSSDPWLAVSDFQCVDPTSDELVPEQYCYFGPLYDSTASSDYEEYPDRSMNLSYADGETLNGLMGWDSFTLGGITVPEQEFGMIDYAAWYGDGVSSGLIGFAYRTLTSMYVGENPKAAVAGKALKYNPFFDNLYRSNTTEPVFSMALTRDTMRTNAGGLMGLGGIPDIPFAPSWISAPILPVSVNSTTQENIYQFYSVTVDGFSISSDPSAMFAPVAEARQNPRKTALRGPRDRTNVNSSSVTAIVDSGTTLVYLSDQLAAEVAEAFSPPGFLNETTGLYEVPCLSVPPIFGVSIGGKVFNTNPDDLVLRSSQDKCISGVQGNHGGLWILGDVWMKAVLCVFDIGAGKMGFAGRQYYGLTWNEDGYYR